MDALFLKGSLNTTPRYCVDKIKPTHTDVHVHTNVHSFKTFGIVSSYASEQAECTIHIASAQDIECEAAWYVDAYCCVDICMSMWQ